MAFFLQEDMNPELQFEIILHVDFGFDEGQINKMWNELARHDIAIVKRADYLRCEDDGR